MNSPNRLFSLLILAVLFCASCGSRDTKDTASKGSSDTKAKDSVVAIDFWISYGGTNRKVTEALVERFNKEHPKIRVKASFQGDYFESLTKLRMASRTNRGPVVTHVIGEALPALYEGGLFESLAPYVEGKVEGAKKTDMNDFVPALTQKGYFSGADDIPLFALPFNRSTPIVFYNKDLFKKAGVTPPTTWDELAETSLKLTERDGDNTDVWGLEVPVDWWFWYGLLHQAGGSLLSEDGNSATFAEKPGQDALNLFVKMVHEDKSMKHPPGRDYNAWEAANRDFLDQKVAMIWTSTAFLNYFETHAKFALGTAFLPGREKKAVPTGGTFFVVMKNKPAPEKLAAYTFVQWMTDTKQTLEWSQKTGYMPVRKSAIESEEMKAFYAKKPNYKTTIDQLQHAVTFPFSPHLLEIQRSVLQPNLERPIVSKDPVTDVLNEAKTKADKILKK